MTDGTKLEQIEGLKAVINTCFHTRPEVFHEAMEKYVDYFGCNLDFSSNYGIDLLNSEHEDIKDIINCFVESKCDTWEDFLYLCYAETY